MIKNISLILVSVLFLSGSVLATSLEEIFPIKVTKQNQSQYNIEVNVSLPTDIEGYIVENTNRRVVNLKVPKKIDGRELSYIHISVNQKGSQPTDFSTRIAFENDFKDANAYSTFFYINIEALNNTRLSVSYSISDNFFLIDLNSYVDDKKR